MLPETTNPQNVDPQHPRENGDVRVTTDTAVTVA